MKLVLNYFKNIKLLHFCDDKFTLYMYIYIKMYNYIYNHVYGMRQIALVVLRLGSHFVITVVFAHFHFYLQDFVFILT